MQTLDRQGVKLCYQQAGTGDSTFLFIPGGSCDWWSFHEQLEHFSADYRCVSLDLRGHGQSDKPEQNYDLGVYVDDVAWVIGELGLGQPIVAGHSMGGAIGLQLAADHPDLVRALVLDDPAPVSGNEAGFGQMLDAFDRFGVDSTRRRAFTNFFFGDYDPDLLEEVLDRAAVVPDYVFRGEIAGLRDWDGVAAATACSVPVLHIAAARPATPPELLRSVLPKVVTGQTVGAGHFNMLEVPDQVNSMIENFILCYVD